MKTIKTTNGQKYCCVTDGDYEEKKETFAEMKQFAKDHYKKGYHKDIHFTAFYHNDFYNCTEPIDDIKVDAKTPKKDYDKFISEIIKFMQTN